MWQCKRVLKGTTAALLAVGLALMMPRSASAADKGSTFSATPAVATGNGTVPTQLVRDKVRVYVDPYGGFYGPPGYYYYGPYYSDPYWVPGPPFRGPWPPPRGHWKWDNGRWKWDDD